MINAGTVVDLTVRGQTETSQFQIVFTPTMLRGSAIEFLAQRFDVVDVQVATDDLIITGTLPWTYTARVRVRTRDAFASASDVASIAANAFYQASGTLPTVTVSSTSNAPGASQPLPEPWGGFNFPDVPVTTTIVVAAVAILVLAWKF